MGYYSRETSQELERLSDVRLFAENVNKVRDKNISFGATI